MIGTDSDHCRIVAESLTGRRKVDEQTFAALAVLVERLERLRKLDDVFSAVSFSADVERLRGPKKAVTVG